MEIKVFHNINYEKDRVLIHAQNYNHTFSVNPDNPKYHVHPLLQAAVNSLPIPKELKLDIKLNSSIPAGSSTGTSGSVCVALLGALDFLLSPPQHSPEEIASLAHKVETEKLGGQSGIQDQICAACGGVCFIDMYCYPQSDITKLKLNKQTENALNNRLCLIYLGSGHRSSALHEKVIRFLEKEGSGFKPINQMRDLAQKSKDCLVKGDLNSFGEIMIENNEYQRSLHSELIPKEAELVIKTAKKYQAKGWKVNGAGGKGGSLTILSSDQQNQKTKMLDEINSLGMGIKSIPVSLNLSGLTVTTQEINN